MGQNKVPVFGGIEAGGTKFICALGTGPDNIIATTRFSTAGPEETIGKAIRFFGDWLQKVPLAAIGIASFGPLDLNPASPTFGYITATPKPGWSNTDFRGMVKQALDIPVAIDTDVNLAALGEQRWGAARELDTFIYLTVGTGIGGGGLANGKLMHGLVHPEMGHIRIPHDRHTDPFPGVCPFHGDCLEGLASGESMRQRWSRPPEELPPEHPGWGLEAGYLAAGLADYICILSPQKIILGGGVMKQPGLIDAVRLKTRQSLNNYIVAPQITAEIDDYIVPPALGDLSGALGAIALAEQQFHNHQ
jgi:fructokinase